MMQTIPEEAATIAKQQAQETYLAHLKRRVATATEEREKGLLLLLQALVEAGIKNTPK